jgi:MYXO-CTERM domain-containing protein
MKLSFRVMIIAVAIACMAPFAGASSMSTTSSISSNFNGTPTPGGDTVWLTPVLKVSGSPSTSSPFDIYMTGATISSSESKVSVSNAMASSPYTPSAWDVLTPVGISGNTLTPGATVNWQWAAAAHTAVDVQPTAYNHVTASVQPNCETPEPSYLLPLGGLLFAGLARRRRRA